jgi:glyoxylase-like metal-dependent hydrolase (beta-lactamase superfamily II)
MTRFSDDIYYYRHPYDANCVVFVFKDGPDLDFVDTGATLFGSVYLLWRMMLQDGLNPRNIRKIVHPHYHFDHTQADCFFQSRANNNAQDVPVYIPKADLHRTSPHFRSMDANLLELRHHFPNAPIKFFSSTLTQLRYTFEPLVFVQRPKNIHPLLDHQKISLGLREGIVYTTGGHTEGHSFIHINDADNILITSDHDALNEFTCNWGQTLEAVRLAERLQPDNVFVGHNPPRLGKKNATEFIASYFKQFRKFFIPIINSFHLNQQINLSRIAQTRMGWLYQISPVRLWIHMGLYAICKHFEALGMGKMSIQLPGELIFTILEDPTTVDWIEIIEKGIQKKKI